MALQPAAPLHAAGDDDTRQRIGVASVSLSDRCPMADSRITPTFKAKPPELGAAGAGLVSALAGLVGNIAGAGLNALGNALADAAKATAVGGEGRTSFDYYGTDRRSGQLLPRIGRGELNCLIVGLPADYQRLDYRPLLAQLPAGYKADDRMVISRADGSPLDYAEVEKLKPLVTYKPKYRLYLEARLTPRAEGFVVQPVYIDYAEGLPTLAAGKRLAAELQVMVSGPLIVKDGAGGETTYGIARIKLPDLAPGDLWVEEQLQVEGGILPDRPVDGSAASLDAALAPTRGLHAAQAAESVALARLKAQVGLMVDDEDLFCGEFETGCQAFRKANPDSFGDNQALDEDALGKLVIWSLGPASPYDDARRKAIGEAVAALREARGATMIATRASGEMQMSGLDENQAGAVSLAARLVVVTNERRFLKALGTALQSSAEDVRGGVTAAVNSRLGR